MASAPLPLWLKENGMKMSFPPRLGQNEKITGELGWTKEQLEAAKAEGARRRRERRTKRNHRMTQEE